MNNGTRLYTAILVGAAAFDIAGCADVPIPKPTLEDQQQADYGGKPVEYRETIGRYFDDTLKDPRSIQYGEITAPVTGFYQLRAPLISGGKLSTTFGWLVTASINAKNSYGGYVGFRTYTFIFRGEEIVHTEAPVTE